MDTLHPTGPLGMAPSTAATAATAGAATAGTVPGSADPSPYDDSALRAMVERLRRDLGEQLVSLAGGGTGFLRLNS